MFWWFFTCFSSTHVRARCLFSSADPVASYPRRCCWTASTWRVWWRCMPSLPSPKASDYLDVLLLGTGNGIHRQGKHITSRRPGIFTYLHWPLRHPKGTPTNGQIFPGIPVSGIVWACKARFIKPYVELNEAWHWNLESSKIRNN